MLQGIWKFIFYPVIFETVIKRVYPLALWFEELLLDGSRQSIARLLTP